jgi:uncharacterized protein with ATP-grasp and redox domains
MSEKKKLIKKMIAMQREFIKIDREKGVTQEEYWLDKDGHPLNQYKERFDDMATKLVDMAHKEKGSKR